MYRIAKNCPFRQLKIEQPWSPFVSSDTRIEKVRAITPIAPQGRKRGSPGFFDPILVIENMAAFNARGRGSLDSLRVARLRVLFELPADLGRASHPLAYIEWYTSLQRCDPNTKLYQELRSSRHRRPNAQIVSAERILGFCHLAAKCGAAIDSGWTTENVLDMAEAFLVNPYITLKTFSRSGLYPLDACL
ncbi:hypothetical protein BC835DRAFT_1308654 [Cytidiella melzeri]|nr:hypothetical protein BC835DRAFT_1308654 [Cytidiella melzeri]